MVLSIFGERIVDWCGFTVAVMVVEAKSMRHWNDSSFTIDAMNCSLSLSYSGIGEELVNG